MTRYRGKVAGWVVVNEAIDAHEEQGLRTDFPWSQTVGPSYIEGAFSAAHEADPDALLVLNEFGLETDDEYDTAADKRAKTLGYGKGKRQLFKGLSRIEIGVPNEYSVEVQDPEFGHLVYDAKVGLVR